MAHRIEMPPRTQMPQRGSILGDPFWAGFDYPDRPAPAIAGLKGSRCHLAWHVGVELGRLARDARLEQGAKQFSVYPDLPRRRRHLRRRSHARRPSS